MLEWTTSCPEQTTAIGRLIGTVVRPGQVVALYGELGAGKTHFTKGLANGLGVDPAHVTSPTFTLLHEHKSGRIPLYHFDLYRLSGSEDLIELGFPEYPGTDGVIVFEWAERIVPLLCFDHLEVHIVFPNGAEGEQRRLIRMIPHGPGSEGLVRAIEGRPM